MRFIATLLLLFAYTQHTALAQADNYSFVKLIVKNKDKQILLVNWDGSWELPGSRYNKNLSVKSFLDSMAAEHGIRVGARKLKGLFTFHYAARPNPTVMMYYNAEYLDGALKVPADCSDIRWFSIAEAEQIIPYPEMKSILKKISSNKTTVWGGAFQITGSGRERKSSILEDFYPWD